MFVYLSKYIRVHARIHTHSASDCWMNSMFLGLSVFVDCLFSFLHVVDLALLGLFVCLFVVVSAARVSTGGEEAVG